MTLGNPMAHRNYHEITASSPAECGAGLGRLFGHHVRGYLEAAREDSDWDELRRQSEPLLAETAEAFPAYVEELRAYAKAAGLTLADLWTIAIEDELDDDGEHCTTVVTNDGRLIAHNEDWDADSVEDICILKKTCAGLTTLELYYYGTPLGGTALCISSNGYIQAINSLNHEDWQQGVPKVVIGRRISEIADADAELAAVMGVRRSSGFAHNLVDRAGRLTVAECSARRHRLYRPPLPFVHTNHYLEGSMRACEDGAPGKSTLRRHEVAARRAGASMDRPAIEALTSDETGGRVAGVFNRNTIARAIVDVDAATCSIWLRREADRGWIDYPIDFFTGPQAIA